MKEYKVKEHSDGSKGWWLNGKLHREDGPAVERADGTKKWWLNGEQVTEEDVMGKCNKRYCPNCGCKL